MFSTRLTRVAHRATTTTTLPPTSAAALASSTAAHNAGPSFAGRSCHQRRPSSSKASCPPDSAGKPAPAAKAATAVEGEQADGQSPEPTQRRTKRSGRIARAHTSLGQSQGAVQQKESRRKDAVAVVQDQWAGLPAVPDLRHWTRRDLDLSSFFSLHRPLSVTTTIPPPASTETFHNIFAPPPQARQDPWANGNSADRRPEDVIYTLHQPIDTLDQASSGASAGQDEGMRWEVLQESPSNTDNTTHLDSLPAPKLKSLEDLVAHFRPFKAPPPPEPFASSVEEQKAAGSEKKRLAKQIKRTAAQKERQYQTTITFTEATGSDGQTVLRPHVSPLVRVADSSTHATAATQPQTHTQSYQKQQSARISQPFLARMRRRQAQQQHARHVPNASASASLPLRRAPSPAIRPAKFHLISVKRQRKLKMKKHKYKKLMKRTRNLRRRLDRT